MNPILSLNDADVIKEFLEMTNQNNPPWIVVHGVDEHHEFLDCLQVLIGKDSYGAKTFLFEPKSWGELLTITVVEQTCVTYGEIASLWHSAGCHNLPEVGADEGAIIYPHGDDSQCMRSSILTSLVNGFLKAQRRIHVGQFGMGMEDVLAQLGYTYVSVFN